MTRRVSRVTLRAIAHHDAFSRVAKRWQNKCTRPRTPKRTINNDIIVSFLSYSAIFPRILCVYIMCDGVGNYYLAKQYYRYTRNV